MVAYVITGSALIEPGNRKLTCTLGGSYSLVIESAYESEFR